MRIDKTAWIRILTLYLRDPVIFLKIIPEKSPAQLHPEIADLRQDFLQRPTKEFRIYRFFQSCGNPKYLTYIFICDHREYLGCIVQPSPPVLPSALSHDAPPLIPQFTFLKPQHFCLMPGSNSRPPILCVHILDRSGSARSFHEGVLRGRPPVRTSPDSDALLPQTKVSRLSLE